MNADTQIAQEMVSIQDPQVTTLPTDSGVDSSGDLHEPIVDDAASPMELDSANTNDPRVSESEKSEKDVPIGSEENDVRETKSEGMITDKDDDSSQLKEEVHSGCATEVLHTDLARPLSVGNRVIAKNRDGKILTVDHNKSNVLLDKLGDDLVMDINCMSLNPLEYMPEGLRKQFENCLSISKEARLNRHCDASVLCSPAVLENVNFSMNPPVKQEDIKEPVKHNKVLATNTADQSIATSSKARGAEIQQALALLHISDMQEMEPEMIDIVNGSKLMAHAMVDAAIKAVSSANMAQQASGSIVPSLKYQEHTNGSLDHHSSKTAESMTELMTSCVATFLMMQMCLENQYPPTDVAQLMDRAVSELEPMYPENMPIYREIQKCMGCIKTQIMALQNMKA